MILRLAFLMTLVLCPATFAADPPARWWPDDVEQALAKAKDNRPELEKALAAAPQDQRKGMAFLIANMPDTDLKSLKADFLLTNRDLAYKARKEVPWGKDIPEDIFLNNVLPYANVDEKRDRVAQGILRPLHADREGLQDAGGSRAEAEFRDLQEAEGEATRRSGRRRIRARRNRSSRARRPAPACRSCSSDACRRVCMPARLVGTPAVGNKRGNHTWVEIWDKDWHFTGACEPDPNGLDRGWFVGDAAQAKKDSPEHAIYAASFKKTERHFPLVWAPRQQGCSAENVTDRYAKAAPKPETVRVLDSRDRPGQESHRGASHRVRRSQSQRRNIPAPPAANPPTPTTSSTFDLQPNREYMITAAETKKKIKTGAGRWTADSRDHSSRTGRSTVLPRR